MASGKPDCGRSQRHPGGLNCPPIHKSCSCARLSPRFGINYFQLTAWLPPQQILVGTRCVRSNKRNQLLPLTASNIFTLGGIFFPSLMHQEKKLRADTLGGGFRELDSRHRSCGDTVISTTDPIQKSPNDQTAKCASSLMIRRASETRSIPQPKLKFVPG